MLQQASLMVVSSYFWLLLALKFLFFGLWEENTWPIAFRIHIYIHNILYKN